MKTVSKTIKKTLMKVDVVSRALMCSSVQKSFKGSQPETMILINVIVN